MCGRFALNPPSAELITQVSLTTGLNAVIGPIHDLMPAGGREAWLGAENVATEALRALLVPSPAEGMVAYPVGMAVNRPGTEGEGLIEPT